MNNNDHISEKIGVLQLPEGSIADAESLKRVLTVDLAQAAEGKGVAVLGKGAITAKLRERLIRVCNLHWKTRESDIKTAGPELQEVEVFAKGKDGPVNVFFHTHSTVRLVPANTQTSTIFTTVAGEMMAYQSIMCLPGTIRTINDKLGKMCRDDWEKVKAQLEQNKFDRETQKQLTYVVGISSQFDPNLARTFYAIGKRIQQSAQDRGDLVEIPWHIVDAGIINKDVPHARDCRTTSERDLGMLCTWA